MSKAIKSTASFELDLIWDDVHKVLCGVEALRDLYPDGDATTPITLIAEYFNPKVGAMETSAGRIKLELKFVDEGE
jgi:hypothetical protein